MAKFDIFEDQTKEILSEAGTFKDNAETALNTVQKTLKRVTGSSLFDGPGINLNKFEPDKRYYPNIRGGKLGSVKNIEIDDANQKVIEFIEPLIIRYAKVLRDPTEGIPADTDNTPIQKYIANIFSSDFIEEEINSFEKQIDSILLNLDQLQGPKNKSYVNLYNALKTFKQNKQTTKQNKTLLSTRKATDPRGEAKIANLITLLDDYIKYLDTSTGTILPGMSFAQRSHFKNTLENFKNTLIDWNNTLKVISMENIPVDNKPPIGAFLKQSDDGKNVLIYRNLFGALLESLEKAIVGATQSGWGQGPNVYGILSGEQRGRAVFRGSLKYTDEKIKAIDSSIQEAFHNGFMTEVFIKKGILIYATPAQWESISKGGLFNKAISSLGHQAFSAGASRPSVTL